MAADLDHRLGPDSGFFAQPASIAAGKDNRLH
jgi:hypothetical protein